MNRLRKRSHKFSVWGRRSPSSATSRKTVKYGEKSSVIRTQSNMSEEVNEVYVENLLGKLLPYLLEKHKYLPEKQLHYKIVRDHVAVGVRATESLIKYWENATRNHHSFSDAYVNNVIPHIPHTEIFQMRKFMSIIRLLNQARVDATLTYCKNVLVQVVKPAKQLHRHVSQSLAANDKDMQALIETYDKKEKLVRAAVKQLQAAEKAMNTALIALNDHKKSISKHFNVRVGSDANEIYRGFLKKKGSGTGFGGIGGRRNWKERLFVLVAPEIGKSYASLNYYAKDSISVPKGSMVIDESTIVNVVEDKKYSYAFNILTEGFHFEGESDNETNSHDTGHSSLSNYLNRKPRLKKTSLMLQAATEDDLAMWIKYIRKTVSLFTGRDVSPSARSSGKGLVAPVSPTKLREVQEGASTDTLSNKNLARDAKGIELEQGAERAKQQVAMYQQQLKWSTESLEGHDEIHKKSVSEIIRKLLRVEIYRGEEQRKLMKKFIVLESIFEEKTTPYIHAALQSVHIVDAVEDIKFFVNNIVGSNAVDNSVEKPIGSLAKPHILSGNRPVISTDLMQELIGNQSLGKSILKNVKDLTSEDSRGSIFDEDTLLGPLDSLSVKEVEDAENNEVGDVEPAKVEPFTEAALDEVEPGPNLDQKKMFSAIPNTIENRKMLDKRSSSWCGEGGRVSPNERSASTVSLPSRQSKKIGLATIKYEGGSSPSIDSWESMMNELEMEKQGLRLMKIGPGSNKGRGTVGSFRRRSPEKNDQGSSKVSRKSRRKSSLTPFAQTLLGNQT